MMGCCEPGFEGFRKDLRIGRLLFGVQTPFCSPLSIKGEGCAPLRLRKGVRGMSATVFSATVLSAYTGVMATATQQGVCNVPNRTVFEGDNLDVMRGMNDGCVDLIYLDPPFNSNRDYAAPIGSEAAGAAFKDTWGLTDVDEAWHNEIAETDPALYKVIDASQHSHGSGMKSYLIMMAVRLLEMRRILKSSGSIYLHCDPTASHYLKAPMDAVFGRSNFRNEIAWTYTGPSNVRRYFPRKHDTIFFYSMSDASEFNPDAVRVPYDAETLARRGRVEGKRSIISPSVETQERRDRAEIENRFGEGKIPEDWWDDIAILTNQREKVGYPTQKPIALLERIIKASSNEGDVVLDPFCGCATTCIAAERLNRQWIGIDLSALAVQLVERRARNELGLMGGVQAIARSDIPMRTDREPPPPLRESKVVLYGTQGGNCNGCGNHFLPQNFTIDHIIAETKGGTNHIENLQLLCGYCNSLKGDRPMEYLRARLARG